MISDWRADSKDLKLTLLTVGASLLAALVVVLIFAAMSSSGRAGDITVSETEYRISVPTTLLAGQHTFALTNNGTVPHELVVFRADVPAKALPLRANGDVNEESTLLHDVADRGSSLKPDQGRSVPGTLSPGHSVFVCNLPAHYRLGMRLDMTVTK